MPVVISKGQKATVWPPTSIPLLAATTISDILSLDCTYCYVSICILFNIKVFQIQHNFLPSKHPHYLK